MATPPRRPDPGSQLAAWYALLGAPVAWFASLSAAYFAVSPGCFDGSDSRVHVVNALALVVALGAVVTAFRRRGDRSSESLSFLRRGAKGVAVIFTLVIIAQWSVVATFDPCLPLPRRDESPDAYILPRGPEDTRGTTAMTAQGTRGTP
jgi:hypothetical protein